MELSSSSNSNQNQNQNPNFYDFLNRMRQPAASDLVRTIKNFIVSFSYSGSDVEKEGSNKVQKFVAEMEKKIVEHPLWANAKPQHIQSALEGLEKYIMTKLFNRTFASSSEDVKLDQEISEKIHLLQHFIKPDHLDIPKALQNEASWLFAAKELQKINTFMAPREKLLCIMNCCNVINNLLLNVSMTSNRVSAGADDFLPVLIFVIIKANPPQLHSNLKYIQLFRRKTELVSEVEYYLTNLISAKTFIHSINSSSLSMEEKEFQKNMQLARMASEQTLVEPRGGIELSGVSAPTTSRHGKGSKIPYMDAAAEELRFEDVKNLLGSYKQLVTKYTMLTEALSKLSIEENQVLCALTDSGIEDTKLNIIQKIERGTRKE